MKHYSYIILTLLFILSSCKSSKSEKKAAEWDNSYNQTEDVKRKNETEIYTDVKVLIETALADYLKYSKTETEYDTEKPILPETGKPPVKKETEISLSKQTEEESITSQITNSQRKETDDTEENISVNADSKGTGLMLSENNMQKESDIFLKWVGGITLFLEYQVYSFISFTDG